MSHIYDQSLRVQGGTGLASAMFRFSAEPKVYAKRLGDSLIDKMGVSESIRIFVTDDFMMITKDDRPILLKDWYFVEAKRQTGVYAYEEWLGDVIKGTL